MPLTSFLRFNAWETLRADSTMILGVSICGHKLCPQSSGNKAGALTKLEVYYCMKIAATTRDFVKLYHNKTIGNIFITIEFDFRSD